MDEGSSACAARHCPIFGHATGHYVAEDKPIMAGGETLGRHLGESWETRRAFMGEAPGITLRIPGTPSASAGPRNISPAYGQGTEGSFAVLEHLGKRVNDAYHSVAGAIPVWEVSASLIEPCDVIGAALLSFPSRRPCPNNAP